MQLMFQIHYKMAIVIIMTIVGCTSLAANMCEQLFQNETLQQVVQANLIKPLTIVKSSDLVFVRRLSNPGAQSIRVELHQLHGRFVILKYIDKSDLPKARYEAVLNSVMSELGFSPTFHGIVESRTEMALVSDYIPIGLETKFHFQTSSKFKIKRSVLEKIKNIGEFLKSEGITNWDTLQFIISTEGDQVFLIDPARFSFTKYDSQKNSFISADFVDPSVQAEKIVELLKENFRIID